MMTLLERSKQKIRKRQTTHMEEIGSNAYWSDHANNLVRIIQESVPGKQITMAHIVSNPDPILYQKLGLDPKVDYHNAAIGIMAISPYETAIIAADLCMKYSPVKLGFIDRFSGTLIVTGLISDVEVGFERVLEYSHDAMDYTVCPITKT
jgi:ethanolamine utilization protein EutS